MPLNGCERRKTVGDPKKDKRHSNRQSIYAAKRLWQPNDNDKKVFRNLNCDGYGKSRLKKKRKKKKKLNSDISGDVAISLAGMRIIKTKLMTVINMVKQFIYFLVSFSSQRYFQKTLIRHRFTDVLLLLFRMLLSTNLLHTPSEFSQTLNHFCGWISSSSSTYYYYFVCDHSHLPFAVLNESLAWVILFLKYFVKMQWVCRPHNTSCNYSDNWYDQNTTRCFGFSSNCYGEKGFFNVNLRQNAYFSTIFYF